MYVCASLLDWFSMQIRDNCGRRWRDESQKAERGKAWKEEERGDDAIIETATQRPNYSQ